MGQLHITDADGLQQIRTQKEEEEMKRIKDHVQLTLKEAETVAELLYTLKSLGGAADDEENPEPEFDMDCKKAGKLAEKIWNLL